MALDDSPAAIVKAGGALIFVLEGIAILVEGSALMANITKRVYTPRCIC
jgi:hypothetical protein